MEEKCKICGCTDYNACEDGCYWVAEELCSKCAEKLIEEIKKLKEKLKKIEEYITSYESISTIQGLNDTKENKNLDKNTMVEMTNRYLKVHDKILSIIKGDE